jgi:phage terminase large subunit-like protein
VEANLVHGEGDALGQPIRLDPFQRYVLDRKYEYDPANGRLLHDRVLIGVGKGNAKTELMAADAVTELAGPIAPISPNVPVSASSWEQANRLFGAARLMIEEGPLRNLFNGCLFEDRIQNPERQGVLYRIAAIAGSNDGGLPTAVYGDEMHEWEGERRERVYVVLGNGLKKRSPRAVLDDGRVRVGGQQTGITTAGDNPNGLLRRLYDHGRKVASGEVADPRFLFLWWEADETLDLDDPRQLDLAIRQANPAAGSFLAMENLRDRFRDPTIARYEFERYHLNRWVSPPEAWISLDTWMARRHPRELILPPPRTPVWLGFDGSKSRDATALVGCTADNHIFVVKVWERDQHDPEWVVPRGEVDAAIAKAFGRWDVRMLQCDPPRWEREVEDWEHEYGERVVRFETDVPQRMAAAVGRFHDAVADKVLTHDGDPVLARHVANARVRETRWGLVIQKENKDSPRRIDAAVAAVLAHDGVSAPVEPPKEKGMVTW